MKQAIRLLEAKRLLLLLAAILAAVMLVSTVGLDDADAKKKKKKKKKRPPAPALVINCVTGQPCNGNAANNTMVGTDGNDPRIDGHEGNDTTLPKLNDWSWVDFWNNNGNINQGDEMVDSSSTSNDTYKVDTFKGINCAANPTNCSVWFLADKAGAADLLDLSTVSSNNAFFGSGDFLDNNGTNLLGDGKEDMEIVLYDSSGNQLGNVFISDAFGSGTVGIKFQDVTLSEGDVQNISASDLQGASSRSGVTSLS